MSGLTLSKAGPSYDGQRTRRPPPPLRVQNSAFSSNSTKDNTKGDTLLYDLPKSPPSSGKQLPPTSSTSPRMKPSSPKSGHRSPPVVRNRSATPSRLEAGVLEAFAEQCKNFYYKQDEAAGQLMMQTLGSVPPTQRAPFSRLQASIRSSYHAHVSARRTAEFQAHLTATQPGGSLTPHNRSHHLNKEAAKERYERLGKFTRIWCTMGMPGTKPFFETLWAIARLQVVPEHLGGAGGKRIEWELDDAVFKESAGKDFMLEAIDVLKGVLGFEECLSSSSSPTSSAFPSHSQPNPLHKSEPTPSIELKAPSQARAPSDPFLDSTRFARTSPSSPIISNAIAAAMSSPTRNNAELGVDEQSPLSPSHSRFGDSYDSEPGDYLRVWTAPDLPNSEYLQLLHLFPSFISQRAMPRFPPEAAQTAALVTDLERGIADAESQVDAKSIRIGTGRIWLGDTERTGRWESTWWSRLLAWFC